MSSAGDFIPFLGMYNCIDRFFNSTHLDLTARVNGKHIDLFRLLRLVVSRGGYDAVSAEKLAWRSVGQAFSVGATNAAAYAFALKTVYYKNLVSVSYRSCECKALGLRDIVVRTRSRPSTTKNHLRKKYSRISPPRELMW